MSSVFVIDGIISAGKSTLIKKIQEKIECSIIKEPVDKWEKDGILKRFYEDQKRWGYHFQTKVFIDRVNECIKEYKNNGDIYICERSVATDQIFMKLLYEDGMIDDMEYKHYLEWKDLWIKLIPFNFDGFIYLRPSLEECMKRLNKRNRDGESNISIEYQRRLLSLHDEFFNEKIKNNENVLIIEDNGLFTDEIIDKIISFISLKNKKVENKYNYII